MTQKKRQTQFTTSMPSLAQLDQAYLWHPFTQMRDWLKQEPVVIVRGRGAVIEDVHGRKYIDANSSIWTNLHGHSHAKINAAITRQLQKIAHSSALGLANEPASLLAEKLVNAAAMEKTSSPKAKFRNPELRKVFFSDNGSTAMEVALKLAYEYARRSGLSRTPRYLSLEGAYHGDTVGAVSLGHIDLFHKSYAGLLFESDAVPAPYCYRCPHNRAKPERADARQYRQCRWQCLDKVEQKFAARRKNPYAAFVVEPLMQGAAGMIAQPAGWLRRAAEMARGHGAQIIADEVMTGFGRTGFAENALPCPPAKAAAGKTPSRMPPERANASSLFACHQEGVQPDFLALAKGLTGGYLPMAATLTTPAVFEAFLGEYSEFKTFFHGHSYTANQLGSAAGLASLDLLQAPSSIGARQRLQSLLQQGLQTLWSLPQVGDIRQTGLVAGIELVKHWPTRTPFDLRERAGFRVCEAMAQRGVLTRPIGNVLALIPPYCTTPAQLQQIIESISSSIEEVLGHG